MFACASINSPQRPLNCSVCLPIFVFQIANTAFPRIENRYQLILITLSFITLLLNQQESIALRFTFCNSPQTSNCLRVNKGLMQLIGVLIGRLKVGSAL
jgi:hypothetical protein